MIKFDNTEMDSYISQNVLDEESMVDKNLTDLYEDNTGVNIIKELAMNNIVPKNKLRKVQIDTLDSLKNIISNTYGPMSSYTNIISGDDLDSEKSEYSKDGLKVLKSIKYSKPIEMSIQTEIEQIARYVEKKVGDGTTSAVILSDLIFRDLVDIEESYNVPPRKIIKIFQDIVSDMQEIIKSNSNEITLENIYDIAMISTNGNEAVSKEIKYIYDKYGFDVNIDVGTSNDTQSKVKVFDGLTIDEGYSDAAYVNQTVNGTCEIANPRIYGFDDPIDTPEMISYFETIIANNIWNRLADGEKPIPTVILSPTITVDASGLMKRMVEKLLEYDSVHMESQKPPILIVTNLSGSQITLYKDIMHICKAKTIQKFIDPEIQKKEQEAGNAPTLETICDFYGTCEKVIADVDSTKFIGPASLVDPEDTSYDNLIAMLEGELRRAQESGDDPATVGRMKKRLHALKANLIEYCVGGITFTDRDSTKDLVEDATKNIASAVKEGVGRAANYEGLNAAYTLLDDYMRNEEFDKTDINTSLKISITELIFRAYVKAAMILYNTVTNSDDISKDIVIESINRQYPFDVMDIFDYLDIDDNISVAESLSAIRSGNNVLCSIYTDIEILNAISRIVTLMVTSNQAELQTPGINKY